jgi:hypothetical protein
MSLVYHASYRKLFFMYRQMFTRAEIYDTFILDGCGLVMTKRAEASVCTLQPLSIETEELKSDHFYRHPVNGCDRPQGGDSGYSDDIKGFI